jgi:hypothetical protein
MSSTPWRPVEGRSSGTRLVFLLLLPAALATTAGYVVMSGSRGLLWSFLTGFTPFALAAVFGMHLLLSENLQEARRLAATGALAALVVLGVNAAMGQEVLAWPLMIGAVLCLISVWIQQEGLRRSAGVLREQRSLRLAETLILPLAVSCTPFFLWLSSLVSPTYDLHIFAFEGGLGGQPSAWAVRQTLALPGSQIVLKAIYDALPLALGLLHALRRRRGVPGSVLMVFVGATALGYALYFVFPAAGVRQVFGDAFPAQLPDRSTLDIVPVHPLWPGPRNGMPSLHAAWAYLVWFNCAPLPAGQRTGFRVFTLVTLVATMSLLDAHWVTDLVVAFPMAVAVQAALGSQGSSTARRTAVLVSLLLIATWFVFLRFAVPHLTVGPALAWSAVLVSTWLASTVHRRLGREGTTIE